MTHTITEISKIIRSKQNILILPHKNADGDCLGSAFALRLALMKKGKDVYVMPEERDLSHHIMDIIYGAKDNVPLDDYDAVITVDSTDLERLGERRAMFEAISPKICLDHHISNSEFADYNYVDSEAAACGEVIYELCREMKITIDLKLATNIYLSISSDTGCFRHANTTARTMRIAAEMMEVGVNSYEVNKRMFARTKVRLELMREYLNTVEFVCDNRITVTTLTNEQISSCGGTYADCDGLTSVGKNITGVEVSLFLRENEEGKIKASLRSDELDVSEICARFGGGGHLRAAGCEIEGDIESAKKAILNEVKNELNKSV